MQLRSADNNAKNYATGLIVNCTGCEQGGPFSKEDLSEKKVQAVEAIAQRLRAWWEGQKYRSR